ncbi:hypothetical protein TNCV_1707471 [Trichonephila clavipes]|uniref:Uncharacterized protein n=1 Tax=Trichonephila clavipes TaxID=2585209 RepID=A0A8X6RC90_TRICX|nr:hypothetical protein TNCV_1707471 [Trichonephila clavipes]
MLRMAIETSGSSSGNTCSRNIREHSPLSRVQLFVNQHRGMNLFHEVEDVTTEKLCAPAFVDQEIAWDRFVAQLCRYHLHGYECNAHLLFWHMLSLTSWTSMQLRMALSATEMYHVKWRLDI